MIRIGFLNLTMRSFINCEKFVQLILGCDSPWIKRSHLLVKLVLNYHSISTGYNVSGFISYHWTFYLTAPTRGHRNPTEWALPIFYTADICPDCLQGPWRLYNPPQKAQEDKSLRLHQHTIYHYTANNHKKQQDKDAQQLKDNVSIMMNRIKVAWFL